MRPLKNALLIAAVAACPFFAAAPSAFAQAYDPRPADYAPAPSRGYYPREFDNLKQLVAPVALYPDAVLAQMFVACTYPDDVVDADRYLRAGRNPEDADRQPWDDSVRGLARFPDLIRYLADHGDWMNDLGDAFLNQQGDVMAAVQAMRGEANAAGNLLSNDDQRVITDGDVIEIVPTDPDYVYLPVYDPAVVYVYRPRPVGVRYEPLIRWGPRVHIGLWLRHDCDWRDRRVYTGDWGRDRPWWHYDRDHDRGGRDWDRDRRDYHYADVRPGRFVVNNNTRVTNVNVTNVNVKNVNVWQRDNRKPAPRTVNVKNVNVNNTTIVNNNRNVSVNDNDRPDRRAGTGYPAARTNAPGTDFGRGAAVSHESDRGRQSREHAATITPQPARVPEKRVEERKVETKVETKRVETKKIEADDDARRYTSPRRVQPPELARPAVGVERGSAIKGYERGADAARESSRGASSRGGNDRDGGTHDGGKPDGGKRR